MFQAATVFNLGDGKSTFFWTDRWLNGSCIRTMAPTVFAEVSARKKKATVAEALPSDAWVRHTVDQNYSAASAYGAMFLGSSTPIGANQVWKTAAPPRVRFFFWLVMHGRCWTAERRFRHGLQDSPVCIMCDQQDETMDHILLDCSFSREGGTFGCINCICRTPSLLPNNTRSSGGCEAGSLFPNRLVEDLIPSSSSLGGRYGRNGMRGLSTECPPRCLSLLR